MQGKPNTSAWIWERPTHWKLELQPLAAYGDIQPWVNSSLTKHLVDNYCSSVREWWKVLHCIWFCMGLIMLTKKGQAYVILLYVLQVAEELMLALSQKVNMLLFNAYSYYILTLTSARLVRLKESTSDVGVPTWWKSISTNIMNIQVNADSQPWHQVRHPFTKFWCMQKMRACKRNPQ